MAVTTVERLDTFNLDEMDRATFGVRLMRLRKAAGLSRPGLGRASGINWRTIESWEQGLREPGAFDLNPIAKALGVSLDELLADIEEPKSPKPRRGRPPKSD